MTREGPCYFSFELPKGFINPFRTVRTAVRFGDKPVKFLSRLPPKWDCSTKSYKRVKARHHTVQGPGGTSLRTVWSTLLACYFTKKASYNNDAPYSSTTALAHPSPSIASFSPPTHGAFHLFHFFYEVQMAKVTPQIRASNGGGGGGGG